MVAAQTGAPLWPGPLPAWPYNLFLSVWVAINPDENKPVNPKTRWFESTD